MPDRELPPTCQIRDWVIFGPGYHKSALYSPDDCRRVPENFHRLRSYIDPVVKLGHDKDQRLALRLRESLGFLNLGKFAAVTGRPDGCFSVTLTDVPTAVGAEVNAGRIKSGSVELIPFVADPNDPAKKVRGPILTGVALLGEEHPAVKGFAPPRAVFADGTPVPASGDPAAWLEAMADVVRMCAAMSADYDPRPTVFRLNEVEYPLHTICFSEMTAMLTREQLQAIGGLTPEQIDQILAAAGGGDAAPPAPGGDAAMPPPPVGGDAPPGAPPMPPKKDDMATAAMPGPAMTPTPSKLAQDDQTMMAASQFAAYEKRLGAMEAKMSDAAKAADEKCMAAYSDRVELVLKENAKRFAPNMRATFRQMGLDALAKKTFADVSADEQKAFAAFKAFIEGMPESEKFSEQVQDSPDATPARRQLSPFQVQILNSRSAKQQNPNLRTRILQQAGVIPAPSAN